VFSLTFFASRLAPTQAQGGESAGHPHHAHVDPQVHQFGMGADLQLALEQGQVIGHGLALMLSCSAITRAGVPLASITKISSSRWVMRCKRGSLASCGGAGQLGGQGLFDVGMARENPPHRFDQHLRAELLVR
jgi:hypothetical protein